MLGRGDPQTTKSSPLLFYDFNFVTMVNLHANIRHAGDPTLQHCKKVFQSAVSYEENLVRGPAWSTENFLLLQRCYLLSPQQLTRQEQQLFLSQARPVIRFAGVLGPPTPTYLDLCQRHHC